MFSDKSKSKLLSWLGVVFYLYVLLVAVSMIGAGFKWATGGADAVKQLFAFATNPFMGLVMGIVATALVQSSSTVTSVIVALCAGGMPVTIAVPMIMGANIGTTITNTFVSLGHIGDKEEFKKAFSAATIHDFFNLISVIIFLPIEIFFRPLEKAAYYLTQQIQGGKSVSIEGFNIVKAAIKPAIAFTQSSLDFLAVPWGGIILSLIGLGLIFLAIINIGTLLKKVLLGKAQQLFQSAVGRSPLSGIFSGTIITVLVQSSSTTTSLVVPLAGSGIMTLRQVYPFALGANIGTCITAILAATSISGPGAFFALQIALVHFIYNLIGVALIYSVPILRQLPIFSAEWLAGLTVKNKLYAFAYMIIVFFLIPAGCVGIYAAM